MILARSMAPGGAELNDVTLFHVSRTDVPHRGAAGPA